MPLSTPLRRALRTQRHRDKGRCVAPRVRCGETLCGHNGTPDLEVHREVECWCFRPLVTPALALARGQAHLHTEVEAPPGSSSGPLLPAIWLLACALSIANLALGACEVQSCSLPGSHGTAPHGALSGL